MEATKGQDWHNQNTQEVIRNILKTFFYKGQQVQVSLSSSQRYIIIIITIIQNYRQVFSKKAPTSDMDKMAWRYSDEKHKKLSKWHEGTMMKNNNNKNIFCNDVFLVFFLNIFYVLFLQIWAHSPWQSKEREIKTWPQ